MTFDPLTPPRHPTVAAICQGIREEIRKAGLFDHCEHARGYMPADLECERELVSSVLCGVVRAESLEPLGAADFCWRLAGAAFGAVLALELAGEVPTGSAPTLRSILRVLRQQGWAGPDLRDELMMLRDATPCAIRPGRVAHRILELARWRAVIGAMQRVDASLRLGRPDAEAIEMARQLLGEFAEREGACDR